MLSCLSGGFVMTVFNHFADGMGELFHSKGFLDESVASAFDDGSGFTHAVAAGQQYLDIRSDASQPVEYFTAPDIRHDHIHDDQVDPVVKIVEKTDGLFTAAGFENRVAHLLEHFFTDIQDIRLIVYQ